MRERTAALREADGFALERLAWAGDTDLLFFEWRARGSAAGREVSFGIAERFDAGGGRAYFDSLALSPP